MSEFKVGDEYYDDFGKVTIRAVFDGYIAFRRPRCAMSILKEEKFLDSFKKSNKVIEMNKYKKGDVIVWLDYGYDGIYEIEELLKTRIYAYDIVKGERKGYTLFDNLKRKYRHATPEEIKAGKRL